MQNSILGIDSRSAHTGTQRDASPRNLLPSQTHAHKAAPVRLAAAKSRQALVEARPKLAIPLLAELVERGDGTFILKPRVADQELDSWITVSEAARILGNVRPRNLYQFLGRYLVYRRPLPRRVVVSLKSALALRQATQDADFWENVELQKRVIERVEGEMERLRSQL